MDDTTKWEQTVVLTGLSSEGISHGRIGKVLLSEFFLCRYMEKRGLETSPGVVGAGTRRRSG